MGNTVKEIQDANSLEPRKVHITGEYVVVMKNGASFGLYACNCGHWGSETNFYVLAIFFKILFPATSKQFQDFKGVF